MALDHVQNSGLTRALTDLLADLVELVQKELQLAKTEITEKITSRRRASAWMVAAGILAMVAALLVVERRYSHSRASVWRCTGRVCWWRPCSSR
jgi:Putative Actinobacterial Holin-X, holin superfamily III